MTIMVIIVCDQLFRVLHLCSWWFHSVLQGHRISVSWVKYRPWLEKPYESHALLLDIPLTASSGIEVGK